MIFRLIFISLLLTTKAIAIPDIAVSIVPLQGIVSVLTQDITTPKLLFTTKVFAHHAHLKPSQLSILEAADLVVLVNPNFEVGLDKALRNIKSSKKIMLSNAANHGWLDIEQMLDFARRLSQRLIQIDASNQAIYRRNLQYLNKALNTLKHTIKQQLAPYHGKEVVSFSNAFLYFLNANQLKSSTILSKRHGEKLSLFKMLKIRKIIKKSQTKCLLSTVAVSKKTLNTLTSGLNINIARIDIIGNGDYFKLMSDISNQVRQCLK